MAWLLATDHTEAATLTLPTGPQLLPELQRLVGGYIEVILLAQLGDVQQVLVLNEDGKRLQLPVNVPATVLAHLHDKALGDVIVGVVIHCVIEHAGTEQERWR